MKLLTEQFARLHMIPLMAEILTDMATPFGSVQQAESAEKNVAKGDYLQKLLALAPNQTAAQVLTPQEKKRFRDEYFPSNKQAVRPFTGDTPQDEESRQIILETLMTEVQRRLQLAGVAGVKEALLPDEQRTFGADETLARNLYRLGLTVAMAVNQSQTEKQEKQEVSPEPLAQPVQTEQPLQQTQQEEPELPVEEVLETMETLENAGLEILPLEEPIAAAATAQAPQEAQPAQQQQQTAQIQKIAGGVFRILGTVDIQPDGTARMRALDKSGQEVEVMVDIKAKNNDDPKKFRFRFKSGKYSGKELSMSGQEMEETKYTPRPLVQLYEEKEAQQKKPENVFSMQLPQPLQQTEPAAPKEKSQPEESKEAQEPDTAPTLASAPAAPYTFRVEKPQQPPSMAERTEKQGKRNVPIEVTIKPKAASAAPEIPRPVTPLPAQSQAAEETTQAGQSAQGGSAPLTKSKLSEPSIMQKKRMVQERPQISPLARQQEQREEQFPVSGRPALTQTLPTRSKKKKWKKRMVKAGIIGTSVGIPGTVILWSAHEGMADVAMWATGIAHCLHKVCLT